VIDQDAKETAQESIRGLFAALGIRRVISIDDYNVTLDEVVPTEPDTVTAELLVSDGLLGAVVQILDNEGGQLGFDAVDSGDVTAVIDYLSENWVVLTRTLRLKLAQAATTQREGRDNAVENAELAADVQAPELFREFVEVAADLKQYSLEQWRAKSAEELANPDPVLILIDKNFSKEPGGSKDTGEQLLADVLNQDLPHVHAGLLTREAQTDEAELAMTRDLRAKFEQSAHRVLAIGKFRLSQPDQFPAAVRTLLLVAEISGYKKLVAEALISAHSDVLSHFQALEDHSVVGAIAMAQKEGVFELEHPLRLTQRRYQQLLSAAMRTESAAALLPKLRAGNVAKYVTAGAPGKQLRELKHADTFEPAGAFNELGLPIEIGDVFERTWLPQGADDEGASSGFYILLAQACDLSIRSGGTRGSVIELVLHPVQPLDEQDFGTHPSKRAKFHELGDLRLDGRAWGVNFTESLTVPAEAIDATVFRVDGRALLQPSAATVRPMAEGWSARQDALLNMAKKAVNKFKTAELHLAGVPNSGDLLQRLAASYALGSVSKARGVSVRIDSTAGSVEYGIRRVARVRADVAVNIAALTSNYATRPAFDTPSVLIPST